MQILSSSFTLNMNQSSFSGFVSNTTQIGFMYIIHILDLRSILNEVPAYAISFQPWVAVSYHLFYFLFLLTILSLKMDKNKGESWNLEKLHF